MLAQNLKLDFDVVVPSTAPVISRDDLVAFKTKIDILVSRARRLVESDVRNDQLLAQPETDDFGWRFSFTVSGLDCFYAELSEGTVVAEHPKKVTGPLKR